MAALIRDIRGAIYTQLVELMAVTVRLVSARAQAAPRSLSDVLMIDSGGGIVAANHESAGVLRLLGVGFLTDDCIYLDRSTTNSDSTQHHLLGFRFDSSEICFVSA